jgi:prepilin-type N-terminal cleavage/methylation domain-containing protein
MLSKLKRTKSEKSNQGFTIIEVMIVLAIAGLILLIVFLAVPALQRSSRNTQRKTDVGRIGSAATTIVSNANGSMAALTRAAVVTEVGSNLSYYDFSVTGNLLVNVEVAGGTQGAVTSKDIVDVEGNAKCTGSSAVYAQRQVAVLYAVESGSNTTSVCIDQ